MSLLFWFTLLCCVTFGYVTLKEYRKYSLIKDTPTSKIRSLSKGVVEIQGSLIDDDTLVSAPTNTSCSISILEIEKVQLRSKENSSGRGWVKINQIKGSAPFNVADETGKVLVKPENAEITLDANNHFVLSKKHIQKSFLSEEDIQNSIKHLVPVKPDISPHEVEIGDFKITEKLLKKKDDVYVLGRARSENNDNVIDDSGLIFLIYQGGTKKALKKCKTKMFSFLIGFFLSFFMCVAVYFV